MLHQITWQTYLLFIAAVLLIYYAIMWLTFYRGKTAGLFSRPEKLKQAEPDEIPDDDDLLGEAAEEYGVSTAGSDELFFGPNEPGEDPDETGFEDERSLEEDEDPGEEELPSLAETTAEQELLQSDLPDLLEDVKAVFYYFGKHEPEERDRFVSKIIGAVIYYKRLMDSELLLMILTDISERALSELNFEVSVQELTDKLTRSRDHYKATFGANR